MDANTRATLDPRASAGHRRGQRQAAALLVKLMGDIGTEQPMAVLTRALGVLEQAVAAKAQGPAAGRVRSGEPGGSSTW